MVATNVKADAMKLMDQRNALEAEMNVIIERLCQPGGPGLSGNLVDSEGFPRSDIDIPVVRADRNRLAELRNDHTDITEKINQNIQLLHSVRPSPVSVAVNNSGNVEGSKNQDSGISNVATSTSPNDIHAGAILSTMGADSIVRRPFAVVDEITEGSPAAEDGLQLGDQIVKFGNVDSGDNLLPRLASEVQTNQGRAVPMVVMRQGGFIILNVTPRVWQGRDLLGCHFRIL